MAMFNNGYPATYQPGGYQQMTFPQYQAQIQQAQQAINQMQMQQAQPMAQTMNSTIVWVKRQKEAEDYLVAPNNSVVFMDEGMTHLYMKSADQFGRPIFSSKLLIDEEDEEQAKPQAEPPRPEKQIDLDKFLTKEEFSKWVDDTLEKKLSELKQKNNSQTQRKQSKGGNADV